ncbi:MAG: translation initiation factor IF-2 [Rhodothermaceae bacterium]|nr:translation initiation factor IF-2 [Rhodothermaceae bacterium]
MAQNTFKKVRLFKILRELNISEETVLQYLDDEGFSGALKGKGLNASITDEDAYYALYENFASDGEIATRVREKKAARVADETDQATGDGSLTETDEPPSPEAVTPEPVEEEQVEESAESEDPAEAESISEGADEPEKEPEPVAEAEPEPVAEADPEPVAEAEPEPVAEAEPEPVAEDTQEEVDVAVEEPVAADPAEEAESATEDSTEAELPEAEVEEAAEPVQESEPVAEDEQEEPASSEEADEPVAEAEESEEPAGEDVQAEADEPVVEEAAEAEDETEAEESPEGEAVEAEAVEAKAAEAEAVSESEPVELSEEEILQALARAAEGDGELSEEDIVSASRYKLTGTKVIGKIDLGAIEEASPKRKRKRKRKRKKTEDKPEVASKDAEATKEASGKTADKNKSKTNKPKDGQKKKKKKKETKVDQAEVDQAYQETLRTLEQGSSRSRQRRRRRRRDEYAAQRQKDLEAEAEQSKILRVTEFVSTGELANLMDLQVNELISLLFASGMMVSINQRLDADTISFVADEYGYEVEFITEFGTDDIELEEDDPATLVGRAPVVTIMGHVDHGKTSLLDYLRSANVVAGEAGGITQHIGAYHVELEGGRQITFLDTPGHEAFTAMRARGAQVTDIVILVVAADDSVMPQTIEAINHAKAADVPIMVAINKIDKADANAPRVQQELADHGVLVEQYGGKVQCSLVSAKTGENVPELLEKVLLEADILELKANPERMANGVVIESRLDKGRGTVATVLVQNGTLSVGDTFVAGIYSGRVRAMFDERDHRVDGIGPALPALVLGFNGAPEVGDQFVVMKEEREAREIAQKRQQIHREQTLRQRKHITLDEIGRRLALGDFQELNLIVKADVGGSVEALSDSLLKLSTQEVAVNIIHSGVGAITESDVMLASASDAVIIGFQVRPSSGARAVAEREEIDVRTYSIIYDAIEDVRDALEGLLSPEESEKITGGAEVREIFKVPRVGTVAGCYVTEGRIRRNDRVRLIRDGIVIYEGGLSSLKRFKDDAKEVVNGYECGIGMENYNDIKVGDVFEAFEIVETKRKLEA